MKWFRLSRHMAQSAASLWRDESGIMLPYVTIMLVVFIGLGLLALDGGRAMSSSESVAKSCRCTGTRWGRRTRPH